MHFKTRLHERHATVGVAAQRTRVAHVTQRCVIVHKVFVCAAIDARQRSSVAPEELRNAIISHLPRLDRSTVTGRAARLVLCAQRAALVHEEARIAILRAVQRGSRNDAA